jgi:hypothetical protein
MLLELSLACEHPVAHRHWPWKWIADVDCGEVDLVGTVVACWIDTEQFQRECENCLDQGWVDCIRFGMQVHSGIDHKDFERILAQTDEGSDEETGEFVAPIGKRSNHVAPSRFQQQIHFVIVEGSDSNISIFTA